MRKVDRRRTKKEDPTRTQSFRDRMNKPAILGPGLLSGDGSFEVDFYPYKNLSDHFVKIVRFQNRTEFRVTVKAPTMRAEVKRRLEHEGFKHIRDNRHPIS
jgi:hypothetical protein